MVASACSVCRHVGDGRRAQAEVRTAGAFWSVADSQPGSLLSPQLSVSRLLLLTLLPSSIPHRSLWQQVRSYFEPNVPGTTLVNDGR